MSVCLFDKVQEEEKVRDRRKQEEYDNNWKSYVCEIYSRGGGGGWGYVSKVMKVGRDWGLLL